MLGSLYDKIKIRKALDLLKKDADVMRNNERVVQSVCLQCMETWVGDIEDHECACGVATTD